MVAAGLKRKSRHRLKPAESNPSWHNFVGAPIFQLRLMSMAVIASARG